MAVSSIGVLGASATSPTQKSADSANGLGRDAFLKLLTTQLRFQNPLEPASSDEFVGQLATFSNLENMEQLNKSFANLVLLQQMAVGANLIGKDVAYTPAGSTQAAHGAVQGITVVGGQLQLQIGKDNVPLDQVREIAGG